MVSCCRPVAGTSREISVSTEQLSNEPHPTPALPDVDVERILRLLDTTGDVHPDLREVLVEPDADRVVDEIFRDEVHAQHA
jgi:hypothetical protein